VKKLYALVFPIVGIGLGLSAFAPKPKLSGSPYDRAYQALTLYSSDCDDLYPRAVIDGSYNRPLFPYPVETASGWWATPEREAGARSLWANAMIPYAESAAYLELPGAPDFVRPGQTVDPTKPTRKAGVTYNGFLQSLNTASVPHPELVPLYWTGFGVGNLVNNGAVNPSLDCHTIAIGECRYPFLPAPTTPAAAQTPSVRGITFSHFSTLQLGEGDTDFTQFLMTDGSLKRVRLGLKVLPGDSTTKGIHTLFAGGGGVALWTDARSFAWHFRPDRAEYDFGSGD